MSAAAARKALRSSLPQRRAEPPEVLYSGGGTIAAFTHRMHRFVILCKRGCDFLCFCIISCRVYRKTALYAFQL